MSNDRFKGVLCGALSAMTYGMIPLFTLPLYHQGMTPDSVLFYRYFFAMLMLGGLLAARRKSFALPRRIILPAAGCGLLLALSSLLLFLSYLRMNAGIASTILFVYPVIVAAVMSGFFHEKLTRLTVCGILGALLGIVILYRGGNNQPLDPIGVLMALGSALSYALYMVAIRESAIRELSPEALNFYVMAFGLPLFFVQAKCGLELQMLPSLFSWGCALALGLLPTVFSFLLMTVAINLIGATKTAILGALEPVTALTVGLLFFGEYLDLRSGIGIAVILLSVSSVVAGPETLRRIREKIAGMRTRG